MKFIKKVLLSIFIAICSFSFLQVTIMNLPISSIVEASSIKISKTNYTLSVGSTYKLKIKGTSKKVKWSTSNKKIATVNSSGKVTAKKKGTCTITGKVNGKKYTCKITVKKSISNTVYITNTGSKYHKASCRTLKYSMIKTTLQEAKADGYTACKICKP